MANKPDAPIPSQSRPAPKWYDPATLSNADITLIRLIPDMAAMLREVDPADLQVAAEIAVEFAAFTSGTGKQETPLSKRLEGYASRLAALLKELP